jgi:hypothetical protein
LVDIESSPDRERSLYAEQNIGIGQVVAPSGGETVRRGPAHEVA